MDYACLSDTMLVKLLRADDAAAFREIYNRYWLVLFNTAKRKLYAVEVAEEIIQDIFSDLWERRGTLEVDHLKSYLFGALKFQIFNYIRSQLVQREYERHNASTFTDLDCQTENLLAFEDLFKAIESAIEQLPEKTRSIFRMNRLENYSVKEISVMMKISERTIEYHLTQSLRKLRNSLKEFVTFCSAFFIFFNS